MQYCIVTFVLQSGSGPKNESSKEDEKSVSMLRKMLREKDARITQMETDMAGVRDITLVCSLYKC